MCLSRFRVNVILNIKNGYDLVVWSEIWSALLAVSICQFFIVYNYSCIHRYVFLFLWRVQNGKNQELRSWPACVPVGEFAMRVDVQEGRPLGASTASFSAEHDSMYRNPELGLLPSLNDFLFTVCPLAAWFAKLRRISWWTRAFRLKQ